MTPGALCSAVKAYSSPRIFLFPRSFVCKGNRKHFPSLRFRRFQSLYSPSVASPTDCGRTSVHTDVSTSLKVPLSSSWFKIFTAKRSYTSFQDTILTKRSFNFGDAVSFLNMPRLPIRLLTASSWPRRLRWSIASLCSAIDDTTSALALTNLIVGGSKNGFKSFT